MASPQTVLRTVQPHIHADDDHCPLCDQPIPNEKADQVRERAEARERELIALGSTRASQQFALERAQIESGHRSQIENLTSQMTAKEAAARAEGVRTAEAALQERIVGLEEAKSAAEILAAQRIAATETAAQERIEVIEAARAAADAAAAERISAAEAARADAETLAIERIQAIETAAQERIAAAEAARTEIDAAAQERVAAAEAARIAAENEAQLAKGNHEAILNERLQEQRDALTKEFDVLKLADQKREFEEKQKLQGTVQELTRQLEKERSDVLGEGAELDLFEELKAHFEEDRFRRVPKGTAGADIVHEVMEDGQVRGKIVYDSKNRKAWRDEFASKLCEDKVAEGAQHAVLSVLKFPAGMKHLGQKDGVILANPGRVLAVAELLRQQIIETAGLRISNEEREQKQAELYAYITSDRFRQHLELMDQHIEKLLTIDVDEQRAHTNVWERRGKLLKAIQKTQGNLSADVARIIGTQDAAQSP